MANSSPTLDFYINMLKKPGYKRKYHSEYDHNHSSVAYLEKAYSFRDDVCKPPKPKDLSFAETKLSTDYLFHEKLGEGTFGKVYKASCKKTDKLVALKKILTLNKRDGIPITALREIKLMRRFRHKNILELIDVAYEIGDKSKKEIDTLYIVTPYLEHDLCALIRNNIKRISFGQIKMLVKQLLEGMEYLHSNNILHRDLKPANLFVSGDGVLKIADFGLACEIDGSYQRDYTNQVITRWYRPLELLMGQKQYSYHVDMWGVGCILAEMLKGKPLFPGKSDSHQIELIFKLCGPFTSENEESCYNLPSYINGRKYGVSRCLIKEYFSENTTETVELLEKLLDKDIRNRYAAHAALKHRFFSTPPLPQTSSSFSTLKSCHEYELRMQKMNQISSNKDQVIPLKKTHSSRRL